MHTLTKVLDFFRAFGLKTEASPRLPTLTPCEQTELRAIAKQMRDLSEKLLLVAGQYPNNSTPFVRLHLMQEELAELAEAITDNDTLGAFDALVDLRYVNDGAIVSFGFADAFMLGFEEVHRSNMSKLEDGLPVKNESGRVLKGKNYSPPDLKPFIK